MAASDQMVWQGELAIQQAIRVLQGQPVPENISPPILILTPKMPTASILSTRCHPADSVLCISTRQLLKVAFPVLRYQ